MPLEKFLIFLNNSTSTYTLGQQVSGGVVVNTGCSEVETQGLVLKFEGKVSVNWTDQRTEYRGEGSDRRSVQVPVHYHESYYIYDYTSYLVGDGHSTVQLCSGETVFPFTFPVSFANVPGTFIGDHGKVEYKLKATLKRRGLFANYNTHRDVHVTPVLDLNLDPMLAQPGEWHTSKKFCCFCCASGPLTMLGKLGVKGFCLGESLPFLVEINNASTRRITNISANLIQRVTYRANGGKKETVKTIAARTSGQEVGPGDSEIWRGNLAVPSSAPPTRLGGGCTIIDVEYRLNIVAHVSGMGTNLIMELPVTVGTVPLRKLGFEQMMPPPMPSGVMPSAPPAYVESKHPKFGLSDYRSYGAMDGNDCYGSTKQLLAS